MTTPDEAVEAAAEAALDALGVFGQNAIVLAAYEHAKAYSPGATTDADLAEADAKLLRAVAAILAPALMALGEQRVGERLAEVQGERNEAVARYADLSMKANVAMWREEYARAEKALESARKLFVETRDLRIRAERAEADLAAAGQRGAEKGWDEGYDAAPGWEADGSLGDKPPNPYRADRLAAQPGEAGS